MDGMEANGEGRQSGEPGKRTRRRWKAADKRRIVREAQRPGGGEARGRAAPRGSRECIEPMAHRAACQGIRRQEGRQHGAVIAAACSQSTAITSGESAGRPVGRSAPRLRRSPRLTSSKWSFPLAGL
jgi:hypothetical protein